MFDMLLAAVLQSSTHTHRYTHRREREREMSEVLRKKKPKGRNQKGSGSYYNFCMLCLAVRQIHSTHSGCCGVGIVE